MLYYIRIIHTDEYYSYGYNIIADDKRNYYNHYGDAKIANEFSNSISCPGVNEILFHYRYPDGNELKIIFEKVNF